jgi:hypothetical protein
MQNAIVEDLLTLFHEIGREESGLALLGEGNTSARLTEDPYLVKASGTRLGILPGRVGVLKSRHLDRIIAN